MKRVQLMLAVVMLAGMAMAQTSTGPAPATQTAPATSANVKTRPPRQAQKTDEYAAFQAASAQKDPAAMEKAADDFASKYPKSELRAEMFLRVMTAYQQQNNAEKAIEAGRKSVAADPDDPRSLVMTAWLLSERTRETDLDKDEKLAEATKDANSAIAKLENPGLGVPANTPPEKVKELGRTVESMAYGVLGQVELVKENFPAAEANLRKSTELAMQPEAINYLRLALALDRQKKYQDALQVANKALDVSGNDPAVANLVKSERQRLLQLTGAPAEQTPAAAGAATPKK